MITFTSINTWSWLLYFLVLKKLTSGSVEAESVAKSKTETVPGEKNHSRMALKIEPRVRKW